MRGNGGTETAATGAADPTRDASRKLAIIAGELRSHFDQSVVRLGVTHSQWAALKAIARYPGATQRTVAMMLNVSEVSAGRLIDRLRSDGLVERRLRDDDRRAHAVFLTDAGHSIAAKLASIARANEQVAFSGFETEDMARLHVLLDMIAVNIGRP